MSNALKIKKKTKFYWAYFILGIFLILASVVVAPIWSKTDVFFKSWGEKTVDLLIAVAIFLYLILYLSKKIKSTNYTAIQILTVVEFVLLSVIALCSVLTQFNAINVGGPCQILGLALWCRGCTETFRAYYYRRDSNSYYPVWYVAVALLMVTLGTYLFAKPFFTAKSLQWIFAAILILAGIICIVYGFCAKPSKNK